MLEFIAILVLIYIAFRVAVSWLLPFLVKRYLENFQKKFYQNNPGQAGREQKSTGRVSISFNRKKSKTESDKMGEYTDFEEIKDK